MRLFTARGVAGPLRGEVAEARSDLEEAISQGGADGETAILYAVATGLEPLNKGKGDECWKHIPLTFAQTRTTVNPRFNQTDTIS